MDWFNDRFLRTLGWAIVAWCLGSMAFLLGWNWVF